MKSPTVSIITVCYNCKTSIEQTILSVIGQSYNDYEYIVIDGNSTDGTKDIISKYSAFITKFISEPDKGIYDAMNKGLKMANGEWIIFRNSGDLFFDKDVLKNIFNDYIDAGEDLIVGNMRSTDGKKFRDFVPPIFENDYFGQMPVFHPSTFIRRTTHLKFLFPDYLKLSADYWSILSILLNGGTYKYVNQIVSIYDYSEGASKDNWEKGLLENVKILEHFDAPKDKIQAIKKEISLRKSYNTPLRRLYRYLKKYINRK